MRLFNDVDLHAFVDGQVGPDRRVAIANYLKSAPDDAARVQQWSRQNDAIRSMFAGPETEPVPLWLTVGQIVSGQDRLVAHARPKLRTAEKAPAQQVRASEQPRQPPRYRLHLIAAAAFLAGVAVSVGAMQVISQVRPVPVMAAPSPDILSLALAAHKLYASDPDHAVDAAMGSGRPLRNWLESRVGRQLPIPDLSSRGWSLRGGRIAEGGVGPAAVLVYENRGEERLSLFMTRSNEVIRDRSGFDTATYLAWTEEGLGYVLVTAAPGSGSNDLEQLRSRITAAARD